jgi:phosphatidylserine decarboxylase
VRIPLAREGYPFIALPLAGAAAALWAGWTVPAGALAAVGLCCAGFFRDPERRIPDEPDAIVSPADGKIVLVERTSSAVRIAIFLSVFDVHVNRAPVAGEVGPVKYTRGRFLAAFDLRASEVNEQTEVPMRTEGGLVKVRQIAGLIARRIVCRVREGDRLRIGERFGLIRFGSRTELILPPEAEATVHVGDRVRGGASVVARWNPAGAGASR